MQIKLFTIPLTDDGRAQAELNRFLAGHKVLEVEQRFYQNEKGGGWSFCVRYIQNGIVPETPALKGKIDYKTVLSEARFAVFSILRDIRKVLANEDAVPAYAVFTDEELANIAQLNEISPSNMLKIKGIGEKKVEKYGKKMAEMYQLKTA
ncbi:MAG: HRDC domain-containing protein [Spirosomataceae bacterium]